MMKRREFIFVVIQAADKSLGMNVNPVNMRDAHEIENAIENFARTPNGGLIVTAGGAAPGRQPT
jgi:hypothetical protein